VISREYVNLIPHFFPSPMWQQKCAD